MLTALALGVLLDAILWGHYARQERAYLTSNAAAISARAISLLDSELPEAALQSHLSSLAFLSQTRVRLLDPNKEVLADSGESGTDLEIATILLDMDLGSVTGTITRTVDGNTGVAVYRSVILLPDDGLTSDSVISITTSGDWPADLDHPLLPESPTFLFSDLPAVGTQFGFAFTQKAETRSTNFTQIVLQPVTDPAGELLGYVELSNGPAYGRDILRSVAVGWGIASVVAVLVAAGAGWVASRRITDPLTQLAGATTRMAEGDLSARAGVERDDELGQLARAFDEMAERIEGTIDALSRFASDASHELHTPLTALRANLELAGDEPDAARRQEFIRRAVTQLTELQTLTRALLDLSRLDAERGSSRPAYTDVDLAQLLRETGELYASRAEQAGLSFELDVQVDEATVRGDAGQLRGAIGNLLDNAVKFTPAGGEITVSLRRADEEWLELTVSDSGIGIPAEELPHLFERFYRGRGATAYAGSGLGLALVQAVAEAHRGDVRAESGRDGARFRLRLPAR